MRATTFLSLALFLTFAEMTLAGTYSPLRTSTKKREKTRDSSFETESGRESENEREIDQSKTASDDVSITVATPEHPSETEEVMERLKRLTYAPPPPPPEVIWVKGKTESFLVSESEGKTESFVLPQVSTAMGLGKRLKANLMYLLNGPRKLSSRAPTKSKQKKRPLMKLRRRKPTPPPSTASPIENIKHEAKDAKYERKNPDRLRKYCAKNPDSCSWSETENRWFLLEDQKSAQESAVRSQVAAPPPDIIIKLVYHTPPSKSTKSTSRPSSSSKSRN